MGGKGSGGRRVGAGRKRKDLALGELTGSRRTRARAKQQRAGNQNENQNATGGAADQASRPAAPPTAPGPSAVPPPPGHLTLDELAVWNELAPLAFEKGTLTPAEVPHLVDLCQARVLKDKLLRSVYADGFTQVNAQGNLAAHPLIARFTTLLQRVDAGMLRFGLAPAGKDVRPEQPPADPFAEFDGADADAPGSLSVN